MIRYYSFVNWLVPGGGFSFSVNNPFFRIFIISIHLIDLFLFVLYKTFPQREQLQQQYFEKVHPEPYSSILKNTAVKNVLADPDVPHGCDANSAEYVSQDVYCFLIFYSLYNDPFNIVSCITLSH